MLTKKTKKWKINTNSRQGGDFAIVEIEAGKEHSSYPIKLKHSDCVTTEDGGYYIHSEHPILKPMPEQFPKMMWGGVSQDEVDAKTEKRIVFGKGKDKFIAMESGHEEEECPDIMYWYFAEEVDEIKEIMEEIEKHKKAIAELEDKMNSDILVENE